MEKHKMYGNGWAQSTLMWKFIAIEIVEKWEKEKIHYPIFYLAFIIL